MIRIPLKSGRHSSISCALLGDIYIFELQWNNRLELYQMDIYQSSILVATGIMLVVGVNIIDGLLGINLPNIYCVKIGFPFEEIGFDDMDTIGFIVVDDGEEIE